MQQLINKINDLTKETRSTYHLTLGELVEGLRKIVGDPLTFPGKVVIDETGLAPTNPHSYRGYYSDLAFEPREETVSAEEFLQTCTQLLGKELEGYKGGEFMMDGTTPLWISDYGNAYGLAVLGLKYVKGDLVLLTNKVFLPGDSK